MDKRDFHQQRRGLNVSLGGQIWTQAGTGTHTGGVIIIRAADVQRRQQPGGHWPCSSRGAAEKSCSSANVSLLLSKCTMCTVHTQSVKVHNV